MKPLPRIENLIKELYNQDEVTQYEHRSLLIEMARQINNNCFVRLKDGTTVNVTLKTDDEVQIEKMEPWYEFDDEDEIRSYLTTDNEEFENFVRWQKLKNILDEE